jgi:mRNA interferase YafQ
MTKLVVSNKFKRAVRKFVRRNAQLQSRIEETMAQMSEDFANPSLGTHKLEGKLSGLLACSCGYDCRIIFEIVTEEENGETTIVLLNVGSHEEVY